MNSLIYSTKTKVIFLTALCITPYLSSTLQANEQKCVPAYVEPLLQEGRWLQDGTFIGADKTAEGRPSGKERSYTVTHNGEKIEGYSLDLEIIQRMKVISTFWNPENNACEASVQDGDGKTHTLLLWPHPRTK